MSHPVSARTPRIEVLAQLDPETRAAVHALVAEVQHRTGHRPLSDHLWLDLVHGGSSWHAAVVAAGAEDDALLAYAQVASGPGSWSIELVLHPSIDDTDDGAALAARTLTAARDAVASAGGGPVNWWVFGPDERADELAARIGLTPGRTLHQMRVALPLDDGLVARATAGVATRPFQVGRDEQSWLEVNNAAFADHAEQGGWDLPTLHLRERETWFDPDGFLLHERDGRLAAFCWTKLHTDADPVLGEIYVIAVHPDFHGLGLGKALTVAGLASIAARGITVGMLYVDQHNTAAVGLYTSLGFHVHRTDRAYVGEIASEQPGEAP